MAKKQTYFEFVGGFVDGVVTKPATGFTMSREVALSRKVKGTRLRKVLLAKGKKKKTWFSKLPKKEKKIVKTGAIILGTVAVAHTLRR